MLFRSSETLHGTVKMSLNSYHGPFAVVPGTSFQAVMTGNQDPDLYVRFGAQPTTTNYHCRPYLSDANEACDLVVPEGQTTAWIMVRGNTPTGNPPTMNYTLALQYTQP